MYINIGVRNGRVEAEAGGQTGYGKGDVKGDLGLDRETIKAAYNKLRGRGCGDYEGARLVGYTLSVKPLNEDISVEESSSVLAVANDVVRNRSRVTGTSTTSLTHSVTHSLDVTWSSTNTKTTGYKIEGEFKVKGSFNMDFSTATGRSVTRSKSETIGSTRQLSITLGPGEGARAVLAVTKRRITVSVPIQFEISGHLVIDHSKFTPMTYDLKDILKAVGKRSKYTTTAQIEVTCFTDGEITWYDVDDDY